MLLNDDRPLVAQIGEKNFMRLFVDPKPEDGRAYYAIADRDYAGISSDRDALKICRADTDDSMPAREYPLNLYDE